MASQGRKIKEKIQHAIDIGFRGLWFIACGLILSLLLIGFLDLLFRIFNFAFFIVIFVFACYLTYQCEKETKPFIFVHHIETHLKKDESVICPICVKTIDQLYEEHQKRKKRKKR